MWMYRLISGPGLILISDCFPNYQTAVLTFYFLMTTWKAFVDSVDQDQIAMNVHSDL